jgi:putative hydrolase of the HAD superfamily
VLSNGNQAQQEDKLRRTGLLALSGRVLTSDLLGVAKPFPETFVRACAVSGVEVSRAVYVGDRLDVDAEVATAAGLRGVWLDRLGQSVPTPLARISSLAELPAVLGLDEG